jgi:hypothetical protein
MRTTCLSDMEHATFMKLYVRKLQQGFVNRVSGCKHCACRELTRLAACNEVRLQKTLTARVFKKFNTFYGTSKFITVFTMEPH